MSEIDGAPDEGSTPEAQRIHHAELEDVQGTSAPSTASSKTETIGSIEDVHCFGEWDLLSDATSDHPTADEDDSAAFNGDGGDSANDDSDEGADQPAPVCVAQPTTTETSIESALVLERSQSDDTDMRDYAELATDALQAALCAPAPSTTGKDGDIADNSIAQGESQYADEGIRRRIQVMVRVRPSSESEGKAVVTAGEKEGSSLCVQATTSQGSISTVTECSFDRVFMGPATQEDVFDAVEPSVQACLEGYNATVFAYGQTGTGKTYTLFGRDLGASNDASACEGPTTQGTESFRMVKSTWGIVPRTLSYLLDQAAVLRQKHCQVELHLSFLQIYNDRLFDLLTDRMRQKPLLIREQPALDGTTSVTVQGLSSERITLFSSAMRIIHQGHTNRCVRETESNLSSSRSHAIVQLHVTTQCPAPSGDGQVLRRARLNLVDLAGSEKWNTDVEMEDAHSQELKNINTSLSALGNCIAALTETGRKHIPYRDSTLTRVLQDSFGGNTQSCLIATVNATQQSCDETIRTLHFADRARSVMQTIRVNEMANGSTELLMARIQIVKLRERLESEQRRRHETRLKEHQSLQRDFQEKLKEKDKEIIKLSRDNAVFQKWRDEDVKKIRALESRVKDLEQQVGGKDTVEKDATSIATPAQDSKRRSAIPTLAAAAKYPTVQKSRSRANLPRTRSDSGATARTYKQVLERYALGSSKHQQRPTQRDKSAFDQPQRNEPLSYDCTNQLEDREDDLPATLMSRNPRWDTRVDDSLATEFMANSCGRHAASELCASPVLCPVSDGVSQASGTNHSWTYSNLSSTMASSSTKWASSLLSKSAPAILIQKQDNNHSRDPNPASVGSASALKQEAAQLRTNASTGSISYNFTLRQSAVSGVEPCQQHKLAGCMLCSVNDSFRLTPAASACSPTKAVTASIGSSFEPVEGIRKAHDGPCARHQLLRCFICMKGATAGSSTSSSVLVASTSSGATPSYHNYSIATNNPSGKAVNYQSSSLPADTQAKCALHSLANCILCAGVKAMTRKVVGPTPLASPSKGVLDTRNGANLTDERSTDRFRRYTLDERTLQAKLATHW